MAKPKLATLTLAPFRLAFGIEVLIRRPQDATILAFIVIFITFILWRDAGEIEYCARKLNVYCVLCHHAVWPLEA